MTLSRLAAKALEASAQLTEQEERRARAAGKTATCRKGCAACCRDPIPISPAEAFYIADLVEAMAPRKRSRVHGRFEAAFAEAKAALPGSFMANGAEDYFRLQIACPFLVREGCSIHPLRPAVCREHLATSDPTHCFRFPNRLIALLPMPASAARALSALSAELLDQAPLAIPMAAALRWTEAHGAYRALAWDGPELGRRFLEKLFS